MRGFSLSFPKFNTTQIILAIAVAGVALRISGLTASAIWFDESVSLYVARQPFFSMVQLGKMMLNPPLWELIVWISFRLFGVNEFALRLPALIASIASLGIIYKLCAEIGLDEKEKIAVLFFTALLPYQFWMAQDGRMYALYSTIFLAAIWFALKNRWLGLIASTGLLMYIHSTGVLYAMAAFAVVAVNNLFNRAHIVRVLLSGFIVIILYLPWLPIYFQPTVQSIDYSKFSWLLLLAGIYEIIFANGPLKVSAIYSLTGLVAIIGTFGFGLIFSAKMLLGPIARKMSGRQPEDLPINDHAYIRFVQITVVALLPITLFILVSIFWKSIVVYRSLSAMLMPLIIWLVMAIGRTSPKWSIRWGFGPLWIVLVLTGLILWSPQGKAGDLREVTNLINSQWQSGDIVYHVSGTSLLPFSYYLSDKPAYLLDEDLSPLVMNPIPPELLATQRVSLESIPYRRAWVVAARDPLISTRANERVQEYEKGGTLVGVVQSWQFSRIEVYLIQNPKYSAP